MELIDREKLLKTIPSEEMVARMAVMSAPTVDAEPVVHGKWIVEYEVKDGRSIRCSECQMVFWVGSGRDGNYCPNCGAKMEAEQEKQEKEKAFWSRYLLKPCAEEEEEQNDQTD